MKEILKEYNQIIGAIEGAYHEAARRLGLSDSELKILYLLYMYPEGCKQSVLYRESGLTKSTVNSSLKKMEQKGILQIVSTNGRLTWVHPTEDGNRLIQNTLSRVIEIEKEIYHSWSKEELALFMRLNRDYANQLNEKVQEL